MEKYQVDNIEQAVELAQQFKEQGKYDCFRGQVRDWPPHSSLSRVYQSNDDELINKTISLVKKLGYTGIGEAEYKYDPQDGEYKLLEINVRSTNQNRFIPYLGADIELLYYLDALDYPIAAEIPIIQKSGIKWVDFQKDLRYLYYMHKTEGFSYYQFFKSYRNVKVDGYFSPDDLRPFFIEFNKLLKTSLRKIFNHQ